MMKHIIWLFLIVIVACSGDKTVIRSDPPTAFVTINKKPKGVTPVEVSLDCNKTEKFTIQVSCPGYQTITKDFDCRFLIGAKKEIFFELAPGEDTTGGETTFTPQNQDELASIKIKSTPSEAEVYMNNELIGTAPLTKKKIKAGTYLLEVRKQGFKDWKEDIQITSGSEQEFFPILESE